MPSDLLSDTITQPTPAMCEVTARGEVGDDVFGDDPAVARLEARTAEILGKEAAVFTAPWAAPMISNPSAPQL